MGLIGLMGTGRAEAEVKDSIEQLVAENFQLRRTAVELALQTAILRERLSSRDTREPRQCQC